MYSGHHEQTSHFTEMKGGFGLDLAQISHSRRRIPVEAWWEPLISRCSREQIWEVLSARTASFKRESPPSAIGQIVSQTEKPGVPESSGNARSAIYSNTIRDSLHPGPTYDVVVTATSLIFKRVEREGVQIASQLCNCSANEAVIVIAVVNCLPMKPCRKPRRE